MICVVCVRLICARANDLAVWRREACVASAGAYRQHKTAGGSERTEMVWEARRGVCRLTQYYVQVCVHMGCCVVLGPAVCGAAVRVLVCCE